MRSRLLFPLVLKARCVSCGFSTDFYVAEDQEADVLCDECRSPLTTLDFPEYYCDLGGEA